MQAPLLQLGPRLERVDAPLRARDVGVGAVQQHRDGRADLVAQGGFGEGEGGLGDQFVVLFFVGVSMGIEVLGVRGYEEGARTRTVLSTLTSRGKSATPLPSVDTDDSRKESEVRSAATQSPYEALLLGVIVVAIGVVSEKLEGFVVGVC